MTTPLIDVARLAACVGDPAVRIADVRWYLGEPDRGAAAHRAGHLPGAVFVDLERDLTAASGPGRHPLPTREAFAATMGRLGFGDGDLVIAYDDRGGTIAARLWWMLRWIGHEAVRVVDGGIDAWVKAGFRLDAGPVTAPPRTMTVRSGSTRTIDREALAARLGEVALLDARDPVRYRGEIEPIDPVAGHIPTARSAPTTDNLDADGHFQPSDHLATQYRAVAPSGDVVVYCGSGVTACHDILAMRAAGLPEPILYPGSWSDWGSAGMPVATGPDPGAG